ncbi:MAG: type IV secretion system DNA-binding domain-containing protein [Chloroflexi bacterium]|nr:type IV secretion system DNA-binding domain-containing protein [Chloroflexota bacterium]
MRRNDKVPAKADIVLGQPVSEYPYPVVRLTPQDQQYHATIWGRTGSGKSRLLQAIFLQHLSNGHGVCLIEPHHDLSFATLSYLVEQGFFRRPGAVEQLLYLDWGNGSFVPFNVLANHRQPQTAALHAMEAMLRVWPELRRAPTFQTLFLSSMVVLAANKLPITFLHQLLSEAEFRERCLEKIDDPLILQTFATFGKARGQVQEAGSALRRAFLLSFDQLTRLSLGQPDNLLPMRRLMDEGRSLIVNLGNIADSETRRLIGALLLVQIEQAALSRTDIPPERRRPWTVLIDEWPSFSAVDAAIGTILEQTRKFGLRLYLAAQSPAQLSSDRLEAALENCRLNIAFGLGRESAVQQSRHIGSYDPMLYKADPFTGRPHAVSMSEQFEALTQDLQTLPQQLAYVKLHTDPAVKVRTLSVRDVRPDPGELTSVLREYTRRYQRTKEQAEVAVARVQPAAPPSRPVNPYTLFGQPSDTPR